MEYITLKNHQTVLVNEIPETDYDDFFELNSWLITDHPERHCVNYFGYKTASGIKLLSCIADDEKHVIYVSSCIPATGRLIKSFTSFSLSFEKFEREIFENFGIFFSEHPWLKPVRYPFNRSDKSKTIASYPFYRSGSEELHEVGVGPVHAGVIEPGHFRFLCNGEQILHLEIQLGYQHRGIEHLFIEKKNLLQRVLLAEGIAGDSVAEHAGTFAYLWESICGVEPTPEVNFTRTLSLELERISIHTGDLSAVCSDIAYQLGSAVLGRLRTPIINFMQEWGGNRLGKGLARPFATNYHFTKELAERLNNMLDRYEPDFDEIVTLLFSLTSTLSRLERTGAVSYNDVLSIGAVGMAARASGLNRDIRLSHPYGLYHQLDHKPVIKHHGDVYSRVQVRKEEIKQSIEYIRHIISDLPAPQIEPTSLPKPQPGIFAIALSEGWRGEVCHCAITDNNGELLVYKIKDPSFHNWMALTLAVRNNEISDFPICNKSFNLSYCGHDL
jgi:Ni,Fe-hydrogenase III large subunit